MRPRSRWTAWIGWSVLLAAVTVVLVHVRGEFDQAHVVLVYLLVILGASATGDRALGLVLACAGFLLLDYFFQPPFDTFVVHKSLDWAVLVAFVATAAVAASLLAHARAQTELAEERAREVDRFASLGVETLNVGRAEDALHAIVAVIRDASGVARCEIVVGHASAGPPAAGGATYASGAPIATPTAPTVEIPLAVRGVSVGTLRLVDGDAIVLDDAQRRSLNALSYYAALAVERARLSVEAEHAAALRQADQLKDALLAAVSHDLRTPLTTIKALAHRSAALGDEQAQVIEAQADRLTHLVEDLLDLSRINGGALRLSTELAAGEDLIGAALTEVADARLRARIVPRVARDGPLLLGRFDFAHSLRILGNLLENAGKYAPGETPIEVSVARAADMLVFEVSDRGAGVPEDERARIFEPFFRGVRASPEAGGAGLGLAIASRLAAAQGGSVTYAPRDGGGSVMTLRLPAADSAAALAERGTSG